MGVDIVDCLWREIGVRDRVTHGSGSGDAVRVWRCHVIGIAGCSIAGDLGVNSRSPCPGMLERLQHEHGSAFGDPKPVAVTIKGSAGGFWIVVAVAEHAN